MNNAGAEAVPLDLSKSVAYKIEGWLKIIFILTTFVYLPIANYTYVQVLIGVAICLLGLKRWVKSAKFSIEMAIRCLLTDFGSSLLYLVFILCIDHPSMAFFLPIDLFFAIGASEFIMRAGNSILTKWDKIRQLAIGITQFKDQIKRGRIYVEFFLIFYCLFLLFKGKLSFIAYIVILMYVKVKGAGEVGNSVLHTF